METEAELGEWLRGELVGAFGLETETWATERVHRITARLNAERWGAAPLAAEILWLQTMNAYAAPGRYVYLSRELLQRTASDDPAAFVIAHEMAHHDLGHVRLFSGWLSRLRALPAGTGSLALAAVLRGLENRILSPEHETAADAYALNLSLVAGYDPDRCVEAFDILEAYVLDHGDLDGVFGPDESANTDWLAQARAWTWQRMRGYPSLRERRAALQAHRRALEAPPG